MDYSKRLRELLERAPPRDAAMIQRQRESFVYGNLRMEEPHLTRTEVVAGIATVDTPDQTEVFIKRRRKRIWKKVKGAVTNVLYIKIPIIDPERLLTWMYPYFRWMFTRTFVVLSTLFMLSALTLVMSQWSTFMERLPDFQSFFNFRTIFYFWFSLAFVKVVHEFGHGLTAKHYGAEVHEMRALLLCLTPAR